MTELFGIAGTTPALAAAGVGHYPHAQAPGLAWPSLARALAHA